MSDSSDRIEKKVFLRAPCARVWDAISDARRFGAWFGVEFDGPFVAGARLTGRIHPTSLDPQVAASQAPYAGKSFELVVDRIEPMHRFSFRWHPFAVEPGIDYTKEPMTLVTFELANLRDGTMLRISESGFERIPTARRARSFSANESGWEGQTKLLEKYLAQVP
ncbi:MAG TPA: SRPBCC family protein [Burkholderiaceae bacterium]|nr:SRPBCC family protein [Burkholderiaceae bacterium]